MERGGGGVEVGEETVREGTGGGGGEGGVGRKESVGEGQGEV